MTPQQQIDSLLELISGLYNDAEMALNGEWDRSDGGFEAQQMDIEKAMKKLGLTSQFDSFREKATN